MGETVAVIGTGAAGLSAAAHLSRAGFDVLALERGDALGGLLHPFDRDGFEFDPGLHYVGQCGEGQMFARELGRLEIDATTLFAPMDDNFDVYRFPGFEIAMCVGADAYRARLEAAFPGDVRGVDRVMSAVDHLVAAQNIGSPGRHALSEYFEAAGTVALARWMRSTYAEFLDWACVDPRLKSVFAAACGDYGLPPGRAAAGFGLAVLAHYAGGGYFPRGGAGSLRDALIDVAQRSGARFLTNSPVTAIEVEGGRVVAVVTDHTVRHEVDAVVAAIDPRHVYGGLLEAEYVPAKVAARLPSVESSVSACVLYLGLGGDLREQGWGAFNVWDYPSWNIDAVYAPVLAGAEPDELAFYLSPNSLKDPTGSMVPNGGTTMEVLTLWPFRPFAQWKDCRDDKRAELLEYTDSVKRRIVGELETRYPELTSNVLVSELATPLSFHRFVNAIDGGLYGPAQTPDQSFDRRFPFVSGVDGLTLAGQGVMGCGVSTAVMSGRIAAQIATKDLRRHT